MRLTQDFEFHSGSNSASIVGESHLVLASICLQHVFQIQSLGSHGVTVIEWFVLVFFLLSVPLNGGWWITSDDAWKYGRAAVECSHR